MDGNINQLKNMNSVEVEAALKNNRPLIIPIGTLEAHGRHLPVGTDTLCAEGVAKTIASQLKAVIAPSIEYGVTNLLAQTAPASFFSEELYESFLNSVFSAFHAHGFKIFIVVNGHGGNREALKRVARKIIRKKQLALTVINWWLLAENYTNSIFNKNPGGHAAVEETAAILHYYPHLVAENNYSSQEDDFVPSEGIWQYPPAGEVLLQNPNEGQPTFDKKKSDDFMREINADIVMRLTKWLNSLNRLTGGLRVYDCK